MTIEIKPKNLFDREISRLNDNIIKSTGYSEQILEQSANNIFGSGVTFYTETETTLEGNTTYKYSSVWDSDWTQINATPKDTTPSIGGTGENILKWDVNKMPTYKETYKKGVSVNIPLSNSWIESSPNYSIQNGMYTAVLKNGSSVWVAEENTGNLNYTFETVGAYEIVTFVPFSSGGKNYTVSFSWYIGVAEETTKIIVYKKINYSVSDNEYDKDTTFGPLKGNFVYSDKLAVETQTQSEVYSKYLSGYIVGTDKVTGSNIVDKILEAAKINQPNSGGCGALLDRSTIVDSGFVIYVFFTIHYIENFYIHRYLTSVNGATLNVQEYIIKQQDHNNNNADYVITTNELLINTTTVAENSSKQQIEELADIIKANYSNGKQTAVLECSIDDYYDEEGNKVISKRGSDDLPMTFKNNDIVYPKRVRMKETIVDGKKVVEQEEVDFSNGKKFRVVGVKVKYDGCVMQELTLQEEKTS